MNKVELVAAVTEKSGLTKKDAEKAGAAVLEDLPVGLGPERVAAVSVLAQVAAELALVVGKAGNQRGGAHGGALGGHADEARRAGAYAFNGAGGGVEFLYVYTWGKIFSHTFFGSQAGLGTQPPFK